MIEHLMVFGFLAISQNDAMEFHRALIRAQNQANLLNSRRVVDPPASYDQFKTNLLVKFPKHLAWPETANGLFDCYLGRTDWPATAKIQEPGKSMGRKVETKEFREFYIKNRGKEEAKRRLDAMRGSWEPTQEELKKQEELVKNMENGVINPGIHYLPGGTQPIKVHNGRFNFKDQATKKQALAIEMEIKGEMEKALARVEQNPEGAAYLPPKSATYQPKNELEARQAFDEASYWYRLSLDMKTAKESIRIELAENKAAKEKAWKTFPK